MLGMTVLCVLLACFAYRRNAAIRQEAAIHDVERRGGGAQFTYNLKNSGMDSMSIRQAPWVPEWLRAKLGSSFFEDVRCVHFGNPNEPVPVGDDAMELLQRFDGLRQVALWGTNITDRGLAKLEGCPDLHYLTLWRNKSITDEGIKSITQLRKLHTLEIYGPTLSDAGLAHISDLPNLKELLLIDPIPGITDSGLKHISQMTSLTMLIVEGRDVTDQGVHHLAKLVNLQELALTGTKVTSDGVQRLKAALPGCQVSVK
jgi:hypothetical protein